MKSSPLQHQSRLSHQPTALLEHFRILPHPSGLPPKQHEADRAEEGVVEVLPPIQADRQLSWRTQLEKVQQTPLLPPAMPPRIPSQAEEEGVQSQSDQASQESSEDDDLQTVLEGLVRAQQAEVALAAEEAPAMAEEASEQPAPHYETPAAELLEGLPVPPPPDFGVPQAQAEQALEQETGVAEEEAEAFRRCRLRSSRKRCWRATNAPTCRQCCACTWWEAHLVFWWLLYCHLRKPTAWQMHPQPYISGWQEVCPGPPIGIAVWVARAWRAVCY